MHEYTDPEHFPDVPPNGPRATVVIVAFMILLLFVIPFLMGLFVRIGPTLWRMTGWIGGGVEWMWTVAYDLGRWQ